MVGGIRTLNDYSIRPKLTTATNYVTTIKYYIFNYYLNLCIFSLMVKYRFSAPYDIGSNPIRCYKSVNHK